MPKKQTDQIQKIERVELDIDTFLANIRKEMFEGWATGSDNIEFVASLIRAAYGKGMSDALNEPDKMRRWVEEHGYRVSRADS